MVELGPIEKRANEVLRRLESIYRITESNEPIAFGLIAALDAIADRLDRIERDISDIRYDITQSNAD